MRKVLIFSLLLLLSIQIGYAQRAAYKQNVISYLRLPLNPLSKDILTYSSEIKGTTSLKMDEMMRWLTFFQLKKVGVNENPDLMIEVNLGTGFMISKEKLNEEKVTNQDKSVTYKYYYTFAYNQPFAYTIKKKDGSVLDSEEYSGAGTVYTYKGAEFPNESAAKQAWASKKEATVKDVESIKTYEFLSKLNKSIIVNKYSIAHVFKENIHVGKAEGNEKKYNYTDLDEAYNIMLAGIDKYRERYNNVDPSKLNISMLKDTVGVKTELSKAIPIYEKALAESNIADKSARINDKVTGMVHYNLALIYLITDDVDLAEKHIGMALEHDKGDNAQHLKDMIADKKTRYQANGLLK